MPVLFSLIPFLPDQVIALFSLRNILGRPVQNSYSKKHAKIQISTRLESPALMTANSTDQLVQNSTEPFPIHDECFWANVLRILLAVHGKI